MKRYFPDADDIGPFGPSFLRLMFACAELDRRVAHMQNLITDDRTYSDKHLWSSQKRAKKMRKLLRKHSCNLVIQTEDREQIVNALRKAAAHCDLRDLLTHGQWWKLDPDRGTIEVRRDKRRRGEKRFAKVTLAKIDRAESELADLEVELDKLSRCIRRKDARAGR